MSTLITAHGLARDIDDAANDVRDRCRWAGYLMTVGAPGLVSH